VSNIGLITTRLFDAVAERAANSPRRRMNHNFHSSPKDNPHRFLNILMAGTYVRPHRHITPPKAESFIVLEGAADVVLFDDQGVETARYHLGTETAEGHLWGVDLPPGIWHTVVARSPRVVCFEVKPGPWHPSTDKDFATWAPDEGDPSAPAYCRSLAGTLT
jgi:cupin fold WbuC family metalloprotein